MAKLLHIVAHPRPKRSTSCKLANHFLAVYQEINKQDTIDTLYLYDEHLPYLDAVNLEAFDKMTNLNDEERDRFKVHNIFIGQLFRADKIIVTSPMWNFTIPAILKAYIDQIVVGDQTFVFTEDGTPKGLVTGKKICFICSRGGDYSAELAQYDLQIPYLQTIFGFLGITDQSIVSYEGSNYKDKDSRWLAALDDARKAAKKF